LGWFDNENVKPLLAEWKHVERSQGLQAILKQILEENSFPTDPQGEPKEESASTRSDEAKTDRPEGIAFQKIPRNKRPKNRIVNAAYPEARIAGKRSQTIIGYKTQNLCTTSGVILDVRTIPATEHDQDATADMTATIQHFFGVTPSALLGDSVYGHGRNRLRLSMQGIHVVAPLQSYENPTGLLPSSSFQYDADRDVYICPEGKQSVRKSYNRKSEGHQYIFDKQTCRACPLRSQCTESEKSGRTVFRSDYVAIYEEAREYNESLTGQAELRTRLLGERKNKELKNDCGLNNVQTRGRVSLQIKALSAAMIVNLKYVVHKRINPRPGFIRRAQKAVG
jgi:hypothetical protein